MLRFGELNRLSVLENSPGFPSGASREVAGVNFDRGQIDAINQVASVFVPQQSLDQNRVSSIKHNPKVPARMQPSPQ